MQAKRRDTYTAVLFLAGLLTASTLLFTGSLPMAKGFADTPRPAHTDRENHGHYTPPDRAIKGHLDAPLVLPGTLLPSLEETEANVNSVLDRSHFFIELYGGAQRLLGRQVIEDVDPRYTVVRTSQDGEDILTFVNLDAQQEDMTQRATEMSAFIRRVQQRYKVPVLYVQAPSKLNLLTLPDGLIDYSDAEADQFLALLEEEHIDTLDLRPAFLEAAGEDPEALTHLFFRTDHHWTPAGAFLGFQTICDKLAEDYDIPIQDAWTDPVSYTKASFRDIFLGSQAKRVGSRYAGMDDLEIWSPKFSTDFTYTVPLSGIKREGSFSASLLFSERLAETDYYNNNPYSIYAGDDYLLSIAKNNKNPNGPRILILRDSYGCALTPFLSLTASSLMAVDPRNFNDDQDFMMAYIRWLEPDIILIMNTTSSLRVDKLYPYLPTARRAILADRRASLSQP